jgi:hypothetical protein
LSQKPLSKKMCLSCDGSDFTGHDARCPNGFKVPFDRSPDSLVFAGKHIPPRPLTGSEFSEYVSAKPSNPKDALGTNRIPLDIVSAIAIAEESLAMVEGMVKYGKYNYRGVGVRASIYLGAAHRHLQKYQNGENRDPKTGVHHLGSARACLGVLLDAEAQGKLTDDRPPSNPEMSRLLDEFEARVKHLKELFKDHDPKHWSIADNEAA